MLSLKKRKAMYDFEFAKAQERFGNIVDKLIFKIAFGSCSSDFVKDKITFYFHIHNRFFSNEKSSYGYNKRFCYFLNEKSKDEKERFNEYFEFSRFDFCFRFLVYLNYCYISQEVFKFFVDWSKEDCNLIDYFYFLLREKKQIHWTVGRFAKDLGFGFVERFFDLQRWGL